MNLTPESHDVDSVAHYVQCVRDLKTSPIFTPGQLDLGVNQTQYPNGSKSPNTFRLPDPRVRDAMVIPFRRIWMNGEPSNFDRVAKIIKRYSPELRPYVDDCVREVRQSRTSFPAVRFMGLAGGDEPEISPEDVIDLWLNCRLAHVGASARKNGFSRSDFECESQRLGAAKFEYLFVLAVFHVGLSYINMVRFCASLLGTWNSDGLEPSFAFDAINDNGPQRSSNGDTIERSTPGLTTVEEDPGNKLTVLRRLSRFTSTNRLLGLLEFDDRVLAALIAKSADLETFLLSTGKTIEIVEEISHGKVTKWATVADDLTDYRLHPWRKGAIGLRDNSIIEMSGDAQVVLEAEYNSLRSELLHNNDTMRT